MTNSIVFDMDGVLFDSERIYARAWRQISTALNMHDVEDSIGSCIGLNGNDTKQFILDKYGQHFPYDAFRQKIDSAFEAIVNDEGLPLKSGVTELLAYLHAHHIKIALATSSGRNSATRNLEKAGLLPYFQTVVTGDMITHGKPAPDIYLLACRQLVAEPSDCFAVEDSPNGVRSAYAAGLKVILVPDMIEPAAEIRRLTYKTFPSLVEVRAYLESLQA